MSTSIVNEIQNNPLVEDLLAAYLIWAEEVRDISAEVYGEIPDIGIEAKDHNGRIKINVIVRRPSQNRSDAVIRRIINGDEMAQNLFEMKPELQGKGLAKKLHKLQWSAVNSQIKSYSVDANLDVGGWAWLKAGYKPYRYQNIIQSMVFEETGINAYGGKYSKAIQSIFDSGSEASAKMFVKKHLKENHKDLFLGTFWAGGVQLDDPDFLSWIGSTPNIKPVESMELLSARHANFVNMFAGRLYNDLLPILDESEKALLNRVMSTDWQNERDLKLLDDVRQLQALARAEYNNELGQGLRDFTEYETDYSAEFLESNLPTAIDVTRPAPGAVWAAVTSEPFTTGQNGAANVLSGFIKDWTNAQVNQLTGIVAGGVQQGINRREMAARISAAFDTTRSQSRTMVRTSLNHISATARDQVYKENSDVVKGYKIVATLDRRTSSTCRDLDGDEFYYGSPPLLRPPFHPGCRTTTSPILIEEFDILNTGATRSAEFGPVDSNTTYYGFLKEQPIEYQEAVLGKTRAKLLRDGGLTIEQFKKLSTDNIFKPTTLEEMRELDKRFGFGAFKRAKLTNG